MNVITDANNPKTTMPAGGEDLHAGGATEAKGKPVIEKAGKGFSSFKERRGSQRRERPRRASSEFSQKVIQVRRVARVVAGGRRFSFSVVIILGDKKGSVGVGIGKASDTAQAIEKALRDARKNMIKVKMTEKMSIPHEVTAKFSSARITLIPAVGRGLVAGSASRIVLDLAGLSNMSAKILSPSKNKLNIAQATIQALKQLT